MMTLDEAKKTLCSLTKVALTPDSPFENPPYDLVLMARDKPIMGVTLNAMVERDYFSLLLSDPEESGGHLTEETPETTWQIVIDGETIYHDLIQFDEYTPNTLDREKRKRISEGAKTLLTLESLLKNMAIRKPGTNTRITIIEFFAMLRE